MKELDASSGFDSLSTAVASVGGQSAAAVAGGNLVFDGGTLQYTTGAAATTAKGAVAKAPAAGALLDLNSASKTDLMKLPGVGEAISAKIIAGRPWANKAQLVSKGIVAKPVYDQLSALVIAKQAAVKAAAAK